MENGIEVERVAGGIDVLTLRGEHDLSTATDVSRRIESALESASGLAIDLSETTFIDSAMLRVRMNSSLPVRLAAMQSCVVGLQVCKMVSIN